MRIYDNGVFEKCGDFLELNLSPPPPYFPTTVLDQEIILIKTIGYKS